MFVYLYVCIYAFTDVMYYYLCGVCTHYYAHIRA